MGQSVLCADCPDCHSEIIVNLEGSHRPYGDNEKMLYRLVCTTCGFSYDVQFEDLQLREKSDEQIANRSRVTTFARG
jgi:C4-type Zn-finger protein